MFISLRMFTSFLVWAVWHGLDDTPCVGSFGVTILVLLHLSISTALMKLGRPNSTVCSYIHKEESVTSYSSFTLKAIIRMRVVYEKISVINCYELQFYCSIRYFFTNGFLGISVSCNKQSMSFGCSLWLLNIWGQMAGEVKLQHTHFINVLKITPGCKYRSVTYLKQVHCIRKHIEAAANLEFCFIIQPKTKPTIGSFYVVNSLG